MSSSFFYVYFTISIMERRVLNMSKIYIEVPKTTDMITASVPCGKEEEE